MQILHYIITLSLNKLRFIMAYLMNQIEVLLLPSETKSVACNDVGHKISKLIFLGWRCRTKKELNSLSPTVGFFGIGETGYELKKQ